MLHVKTPPEMPPLLLREHSGGVITRFLGHGRALESLLVFVKFHYSIMFFAAAFTGQDTYFIAFIDLNDKGEWWKVGVVFLCASIPQSVGLVFHYLNMPISKYFRVIGASVGFGIWVFALWKQWINIGFGIFFSGVEPCFVGFALASIFIIWRGFTGFPRPPGEL